MTSRMLDKLPSLMAEPEFVAAWEDVQAGFSIGRYKLLLNDKTRETMRNTEEKAYAFPHRLAGMGAIIGDIVGSPYEFDRGGKTEDFPLFSEKSYATDDTILTLAVASGLIEAWGKGKEATARAVTRHMQVAGWQYPHAGYGARFLGWIDNPVPYGSFGNGSAMRVSAVGWLFDNIDDVLRYARITAEVSHNHPEGIKGAQAVAAAIFLTRGGMDKASLKEFVEKSFGYDLGRSLADIRPTYHHVESCQETVPEAITAYLEGASFEDVLRKAVSLGGDADTLTAIAASIAEAAYPVPSWIREEAFARLDGDMKAAVAAYEGFVETLDR